jgi:predicted CXXCH cytochrome family protein
MIRVAIILVFLFACGSPRSTTPSGGAGQGGTGGARTGSIAVDTDRFPHGVHTGDKPEIKNWQGRGLGCADCHDAKAVVEGKIARPGANQHAPCDDCHKAEFFKAPGALCRVCHKTVDPFKPHGTAGWEKNPDLQPYPERGTSQTLASNFNHELHLSEGKMESATGAHVACSDCHERNEQTRDPLVPTHKHCIRCHQNAPKVNAVLNMGKCDGCHARKIDLVRGRRFITGDLRFAHSTHEKDKAGNGIACETCHDTVRGSATRDDMRIPQMEVCAQCHEDSQRTPDNVRMDQCGVCHAGGTDLASAPPNHGGTGGGSKGGARPPDHTLAFRKHHGEQAAAKDAPCRRCHTELQGTKEDSCFQCHQVMRPRDHNLIWRNDHGRDAQTDATRCANCHAPESCSGCHAIPPRSHTPLGDFRNGGHAEQARFNLSACMTCHTYESTCSSCHRGTR